MKNSNPTFATLASDETITTTREALTKSNITTHIASSKEEAIQLAKTLIPESSEVMTATSTTLDQLDLTTHFNDSGNYNSVKSQLVKMDRATQGSEMQKLGAAPEYVIGSVHAVTADGKIVIASGSGSQLPAYSYGAQHVVWIVSTKKIVQNLDEAMDRIYTHVLPLEDARMKKVYGPDSGSNPNKLLILNRELNPQRINVIFVKEDLGF